MSTTKIHAWRSELRGGVESALQGIPLLLTPSLLSVGILGALAAGAGLWGALLAITFIPGLRLWCRGSSAVIAGPRIASTATYAALALNMALLASDAPVRSNAVLTLSQLRMGLAAASVMYLIASLLILLSGLLRLGRVFKMIPTPVTSGISNGTALILLVLAAHKVDAGGVAAGLTAATMLAVHLAWPPVQRRLPPLRFLPTVVMVLLSGLLCVMFLGGLHVETGAASVGQDPVQWTSVALWPSLNGVQLGVLVKQGIPATITLALVMVLETFTAASTMEIRFGERYSADRELIALGGANMVGALVGSLPCSGSPVYSVAARLSGGRGRMASFVCFAVSGIGLVFLNPWLMALPSGLAAGLLILQSTMMVSPAFLESLSQVVHTRRWTRPQASDLGFWITVVISLVGFFGNLIWATFAGVGLSCLVVLRRVSANLTARWVYLDGVRSRRIRTLAEADALTHLAHHVGVLRMTGHLFFGNSARITQLADELDEDCICAVIDVSAVQDADPSGRDAVLWLVRALKERNLQVVIAGLSKCRVPSLQTALDSVPVLDRCIDLDRGLERCEEWVLQNATALPRAQAARVVEGNSLLRSLDEEEITAVLMVAEERQVDAGMALFRKDDPSNGVWMLQSGQVSILAGSGASSMRLATFGPGQFVGEMGLIDGNTRSATVTADTPVQAVLLDNHGIAALVRDHPQAALKITRNIARELSQRVRSTSAVLAQEWETPSAVWGNSMLSVVNK